MRRYPNGLVVREISEIGCKDSLDEDDRLEGAGIWCNGEFYEVTSSELSQCRSCRAW
jgi:hypothetical protein